MAMYEFRVRVAFDGSWSLPGTWTDITSYVRWADGVTFNRGGAVDDEPFEPGMLNLSLNNDGRFTAGRVGAYGLLGLRLPINVQVRYPRASGDWYDLWSGWIDDWGNAATNGIRGIAQVKASNIVNRLPAGSVRQSAIIEAMLAFNVPHWIWAMQDPPGSTRAALTDATTTVAKGAALTRVDATAGGGYLDFGVSAIGADADTAVAFTPIDATHYSYLQTRTPAGDDDTAFFAVVTRSTAAAAEIVSFWSLDPVTGVYTSPHALTVTAAGQLQVSDPETFTTWNTGLFIPADGSPHVVTSFWTGGASFAGVDGVSVMYPSGGVSQPYGTLMKVGTGWSGTISHVGYFAGTAAYNELLIDMWAAVGGERTASDWMQKALDYSRLALFMISTGGDGDSFAAPPMKGRGAAEIIGDLVASERGRVFASASSGDLVFDDRAQRYVAPVAWTVPAAALASDTDFPFNLERVINDARVGTKGLDATFVDQTSIDRYGPAQATIDAPLVDQTQGEHIASWVVLASLVPRPRSDDLIIDLVTKAASIPLVSVITAEPGQRIQVTALPPWAPVATLDVVSDGISDRIDHQSWERSFTLSPAAPWTSVWTIGDPVLGKVQSGNVIAL